jgi:hypothetical protein
VVRKPEGKRPVERPRYRWDDKVNNDLREIECKVADWIHLAHDKDQWQALIM